MILGQILVQFMFRLTFGVALAMGITPWRLVTSGYYRINLWVLMGFNTLAALVLWTGGSEFQKFPAPRGAVLGISVLLAVGCYAASVVWLYEKARAGSRMLFLIALAAVIASALATPWSGKTTGLAMSLAFLDLLSSGLLLGVTLAAMLLGHWYLNTPTMELVPLRMLVRLMIAAVLARAVVCAVGLGCQLSHDLDGAGSFWVFLGFRWLSGMLGTMTMALLAWYTLKVPNTQSATGILYAGVILAFLGELVSQLLSVDQLYPL